MADGTPDTRYEKALQDSSTKVRPVVDSLGVLAEIAGTAKWLQVLDAVSTTL